MGAAFAGGPEARKSSAYQRDLVDTTRQALGNIGLTLRDEMAVAYDRKDAAAFKRAADKFMALGCRPGQVSGRAQRIHAGQMDQRREIMGGGEEEQPYYEKDARSIITVWGGGLTDYAGTAVEWVDARLLFTALANVD